MSQLFQSYQQQFIKAYSSITRKINSISVVTNQKKELAFIDIRADLSEAQQSIKLMETQITGLPQQTKLPYIQKYKKDYDDVKKKLNREEEQYSDQKCKEALLNAQLDSQQSQTYTNRFIRNGQQHLDITNQLKQSKQVMYGTLEIADNTGLELARQTGIMQGEKEKLISIRDDLKIGQKTIKSMMMRIRKNKFVMLAVIAAILLIGVIILAVKLTKK